MRLIATVQQERDTFRDETKDLTEQKNKLISQNTILTSSYKEKCVRLDQRIKTLMTQNEELVNRVMESEKQ